MAREEENNSATASPTGKNVATSYNETSTLSIIKPKSQLAAQLDENNYLPWKYQTKIVIRGYGLKEYVNDTLAIPPKMIQESEGKIVTNKEYINYQRQDSLLASWLMSSISVSFLSQIVGCRTSQKIWEIVEQIFNSQSTAIIMHCRRQPQGLRKDNMSMGEYLTKVKTYCDLLETIGHKVSEAKQILTILSDLDDAMSQL